jgi:hypothetical protein
VEAWSRTKAHPIDGITLRCRAHNQQRARIDFGEPHMARFHRRGGDDPRSPPLFAAEAEAHHRLRKRFGHRRGRRADLNADT